MQDWLKLALVLLALPAQLMVQEYFAPPDASSGTRELFGGGWGLFDGASELVDTVEELTYAVREAAGRLWRREDENDRTRDEGFGSDGSAQESQHEVRDSESRPQLAQTPTGSFASGNYIRQSRSGVHYRVGQIFRHRRWGYIGVIIGWDRTARAPEQWFKENRVAADVRQKPFYGAIVILGDKHGSGTRTYVSESNIQLLSPEEVSQVNIPKVIRSMLQEQFFVAFDRERGRFTPKRKLLKQYPNDYVAP